MFFFVKKIFIITYQNLKIMKAGPIHKPIVSVVTIVLFACLNCVASSVFEYSLRLESSKVSQKEIELDGEMYTEVQYQGLINGGKIGAPSLPVKQIFISVPYNATNIRVEASPGRMQSVLTPYKILPNVNAKTQISIIDSLVIKNDELSLSNDIANIDFIDYAFGGHKIVSVSVTPFTVDSNPRLFTFRSSITLRCTWDISNDLSSDHMSLICGPMIEDGMDYVKKLVINPDDVANNSPIYNKPQSVDDDDSGIIDYLIIAPDRFCDALQELKQLRRMKGYRTEITPLSHILKSGFYEGDDVFKPWPITDDAGKIRKYLKLRYENDGVRNVLLAGKYPEMPIRYLKGCSTFSTDTTLDKHVPTDLYFSDFNAEWRSCSIHPDVYSPFYLRYCSEVNLGRIPFENTDEIKDYISKIKIYEFNPGNGDASYLGRGLFTRQNEHFMKVFFDDDVIHQIDTVFEDSRFLENKTGDEIVKFLNSNKFGSWQFFGHGCPEGVKTYQGNETYDHGKILALSGQHTYLRGDKSGALNEITNKYYPSWQYSISCSVMPFDIYKEGNQIYNVTKNFGESYILGKEYGGVAIIGNTREYDIHRAKECILSFYPKLKEYYSNSERISPVTAGEMISEIRTYPISTKPNSSVNDARTIVNLFGDPLVPLFIKEPKKLAYKENNKIDKAVYTITTTPTEQLLFGTMDIRLKNAAKLKPISNEELLNIDIYPNIIQTIYGKNTLPCVLPVHLYGITLYDTEFVCDRLYIQKNNLNTLKKNAYNIEYDGKVVVAKDHKAKIHAMGFTCIDNLLQLQENSTFELFCDKDVEIDNIYVPNGAKLIINANNIYIGDYGIQKHSTGIVELISRESKQLKRISQSNVTKELAVEGRTWWYRSEQRSTGNHQEYGIRIGKKERILAETWRKVYLCRYTDKLAYNVEATTSKEDTLTFAYIKEKDGKICAVTIMSDILNRVPALDYYLPPTCHEPNLPEFEYLRFESPFNLYFFGEKDKSGLYGIGSDSQIYTIKDITTFTNSGYDHELYTTVPQDDFGGLWLPEKTYEYVKGIGSPKTFLLLPSGGGNTSAFGWDYPELTYVTEGEDNRIVFEAKGGIKLWEVSGVQSVTVDDDTHTLEWYNLQGQQIAYPTTPGLYIRRAGNKSEKIYVNP